jgi:5'-3' exonuclease
MFSRTRDDSNNVAIHVVDGTYELFRAYFGAPKATAPDGREVGATRGIIRSLYSLLRPFERTGDPSTPLGAGPVTHVACAFDHVIESFRNDLYAGYKTSAGVPEDLLSQFSLAERATHALGIVVWSMVEFEADDALATAAARWESAPGVDRVVICTPDKDVAQCVRDTRVVAFDRLRRRLLDEDGVVMKFGVPPASIPDWLALVGDAADGYPGVPRWGAKSAATMLAVYKHIDAIPDDARTWRVDVRGAAALAESLRAHRDEAMLYRHLATLRTDVPLAETLDDLRWLGARREELTTLCREIGDEAFLERITTWREPARS